MRERYQKRQLIDSSNVEYFVSLGYPRNLAEALCARGVTKDNYSAYFGEDCFHSPFEMKNMQEAADTISYVLEEGGSVLICGDYDADGLTASSILSLFFSDNGIDNDVIIPTRDEGYGLHAELVLKAFEKKFYDLVVTVDCGISNASEIDRIIDELGVEIIVTDHHELPDVLPNCLCVNPKMGYPFPNLAGAGVAWKLVEALAGREVAAKYSDLAMVGTIGDVMPLQDENRSLVKLGLANFHHKSLQKLAELSKCSQNPTASEIAMKLTPKINAAGRVGAPDAALQLLLARDKANAPLANKLLELNNYRRDCLNDLQQDADLMCDSDRIRRERLVYLYSDKWMHGILGIAAARYKEKYNFPAVVMTKNEEGLYVGSARSVDDVNLFEVFVSCSDLLVKFGGHRASVGFSVSEENLLALEDRLSQTLRQLPENCFEKKLCYDVDLTSDCVLTEMFAFSQKLQPYLPQDKLIFRVAAAVKYANAFGADNAHLSLTLQDGLELKGFFGYGKYAPYIKNGADVEALVSLEYNEYTHKIGGIIEDMHLLNSVCFDEWYKLNFLQTFDVAPVKYCEDVKKLLQGNSVLAVFDDFETYARNCQKYGLEEFYVDLFVDNSIFQRTVAISPVADYGFDKYQTVVCFCKEGMHRNIDGAKYVQVQPADEALYQLQLDRSVCAKVYAALKRKSSFDSVHGTFDKYLAGSINYAQYVVAIRVFEELNFIRLKDKYTVEFLPSEKSDLTNSRLFKCFDNTISN